MGIVDADDYFSWTQSGERSNGQLCVTVQPKGGKSLDACKYIYTDATCQGMVSMTDNLAEGVQCQTT